MRRNIATALLLAVLTVSVISCSSRRADRDPSTSAPAPSASADLNLVEPNFQPHASGSLKVGDKVPDLTARSLGGEEFRMADYRGRMPVLIAFISGDKEGSYFRNLMSAQQYFEGRVKIVPVTFYTAGNSKADSSPAFFEENRQLDELFGSRFGQFNFISKSGTWLFFRGQVEDGQDHYGDYWKEVIEDKNRTLNALIESMIPDATVQSSLLTAENIRSLITPDLAGSDRILALHNNLYESGLPDGISDEDMKYIMLALLRADGLKDGALLHLGRGEIAVASEERNQSLDLITGAAATLQGYYFRTSKSAYIPLLQQFAAVAYQEIYEAGHTVDADYWARMKQFFDWSRP